MNTDEFLPPPSNGPDKADGCTAVLVMVMGFITLTYALPAFQDTWTNFWTSTFWFERLTDIFTGALMIGMVGFGGTLVLYPFRRFKVIQALQGVLVLPLVVALRMSYYYQFGTAILLALAITIFIPLTMWRVLQNVGAVPILNQEALLYAILVADFLLLARYGDKIVAGVIRVLNVPTRRFFDHRPLLRLLRPAATRLYLYAVTAAAYIVANLETFGSVSLISAGWWVAYKAVLLEVLLTYVAIDAVAAAWRDLGSKTN
jgi:hypothetical protein